MTQEWEEHEPQEQSGKPGMEQPEADFVEQRRPLDDADDPEASDAQPPNRAGEADDADVQEQSRAVPQEEDNPG